MKHVLYGLAEAKADTMNLLKSYAVSSRLACEVVPGQNCRMILLFNPLAINPASCLPQYLVQMLNVHVTNHYLIQLVLFQALAIPEIAP